MAELSLPQRVAKTVGEGWGCLFIGMHSALKRQFERKRSVQILVGHGGAADTWRWGCHALPQRVHVGGGVVPQAADTWRWGCHALGAKAKPARLTAHSGERGCKSQAIDT